MKKSFHGIIRFLSSSLLLLLSILSYGCSQGNDMTDRIQPWPDNRHYMAWGDTPVFLIGPAGYHGWTPISRPAEMDFHEQLHRLDKTIREIGSPNVCGFVRCLPYDPMNHMHDGIVTEVLQPWLRLDDGRFDLEHFEPAWEKRLREYLDLALSLRIVVSMEIWDDWSVTRGSGGAWDPGPEGGWNAHPFNPRNNINYGNDVLPEQTSQCDAPFYNTIPSRSDIPVVLNFQKLYVDHLLSIIKDYPHIIINISNESRANLEWSRFWAGYIREVVPPAMMIGEMPSTNGVDGGGECETLFSPMTLVTDSHYDYVDISQAISGHEFSGVQRQAIEGSRKILEYRLAMAQSGTIRPLIVSKDYTRGPDGGTIVFWSRFAGGAASARFHRPAADHPESLIVFQHEAAGHLGQFIARIPFWLMHPCDDVVNMLPDAAGANVLSDRNSHYVIQLIGGVHGEKLGVVLPSGKWTVEWIDPSSGTELVKYDIDVDSGSQELEIHGEQSHRIIYLSRI
jgi:hypothetical protein